jgi:Tfp pilus assembly protein PilN
MSRRPLRHRSGPAGGASQGGGNSTSGRKMRASRRRRRFSTFLFVAFSVMLALVVALPFCTIPAPVS